MPCKIHGSLSVSSLLAGVIAIAGCGGATPPPSGPHDAPHGHHAGEHGHGHGHGEHGHGHGAHHDVEGPLGELHEVIAPVWHAEPGAVRVEAACAKTSTMKERAAALKAPEAMPAAAKKDEAGWSREVTDLGTNVDALAAACAAAGRPDVEPALSKVHDGFHHLMERAR